jgi:hypothetical protein
MSAVDLQTPASAAIFAALVDMETDPTMPAGTGVYTQVPEDTVPPMVVIDAIGSKAYKPGATYQLDRITVGIRTEIRSGRRSDIVALQHGVRTRLDGQTLEADGVAFGEITFLQSETSGAIEDGVTYLGLSLFEFLAQPA